MTNEVDAKVDEAYAYVGYAAMVAKVEVPYAKLGKVDVAYPNGTKVEEAYVLVTVLFANAYVEDPYASDAKLVEAYVLVRYEPIG